MTTMPGVSFLAFIKILMVLGIHYWCSRLNPPPQLLFLSNNKRGPHSFRHRGWVQADCLQLHFARFQTFTYFVMKFVTKPWGVEFTSYPSHHFHFHWNYGIDWRSPSCTWSEPWRHDAIPTYKENHSKGSNSMNSVMTKVMTALQTKYIKAVWKTWKHHLNCIAVQTTIFL